MKRESTQNWRERLANPLTLHIVGVGALAVLVMVLVVRLGMDWSATSDSSTGALSSKQIELKALDLETAPLRGLDKRVDLSRTQIKDFLNKRIPANYSLIATTVGDLSVKSGVRLTRVTYTQGLPGSDLTEISMDAGISGGYPQIMRFVNSIERDHTFFVIRAMSLTGQQGGTVNLRLRVSTWLRAADAAASGLPPTPDEKQDANGTSSRSGKEGQ